MKKLGCRQSRFSAHAHPASEKQRWEWELNSASVPAKQAALRLLNCWPGLGDKEGAKELGQSR